MPRKFTQYAFACTPFSATGTPISSCFGKTLVPSGADKVDLFQRASLIRLIVDFLDKDGNIAHSVQTPFKGFPEIAVEKSQSAPYGREAAFFDYCARKQGIFYTAYERDGGGGGTIIFPPGGSRIDAVLNVLLPNEKIGQIASIRAYLKSNPPVQSRME